MHRSKWPFLLILNCIWTRCGRCENLGQIVPWVELPVQRRLFPIFREWCQVTRHPRVLRGLTGCQRTPGKWSVTTIVKNFLSNEKKYKEIFEIIDKRWEIQLHQTLQADGYFLNP